MNIMECAHEKVVFEGMFSMIGDYVCRNCKLKITPFVYHKMKGYEHIIFRSEYRDELLKAVDSLNEENKKLWDKCAI